MLWGSGGIFVGFARLAAAGMGMDVRGEWGAPKQSHIVKERFFWLASTANTSSTQTELMKLRSSTDTRSARPANSPGQTLYKEGSMGYEVHSLQGYDGLCSLATNNTRPIAL
eukprot:scaffold84564_cov32-Tisochrysis_lutea.AAC.4